MKIYLDDVRPTPEGWTHSRTAEETFELIKAGGVKEVSLDNDLGGGYTEGYMVMRWLEELVLTDQIPYEHLPERFTFHTDNVDRQSDMITAWKNLSRHLAAKDLRHPRAHWNRLRFGRSRHY